MDPLADMLLGQAAFSRGPNRGQTVGDGQDRRAAAGQSQGRRRAAAAVLQAMTRFGGEDDHQLRLAAAHEDSPVVDLAGALPPRSTKAGRTS
ncbi:MAG TPA: hypothetical protein VKP69_00105, partial [Isosphaeraceae bacterium]|nr:hypothetical protein [Isosphaeraceae bacterium]